MKGRAVDKQHVVLIVDDTPENLHVLGDILEQQGYEVLVATNGPDALERAGTTPMPELILLDIMMPGMDGYEVCRRLKADPDLQHIPVIFISSSGMAEQEIQAFREGAVDYVTKPFRVEEVVARVRTHIQLAQVEKLKHENAEYRLAEAESRQIAINFKNMADVSLLAIYCSTGVDQKAFYINVKFTELFGYVLEDVRQLPIGGHGRIPMRTIARRSLRNGKTRSLRQLLQEPT
jgi:CheY-like chemotaxis protein